MSLGSIIVSLRMKTAEFETDSGRAAKIAERRAKQIDASFRKAGLAIGAALGVAAVAITSAIKRTLDEADKFGKLAQSVGVSVEALSRLDYAAKLSGVSIEELGNGIKRLGQFQAGAISGSKENIALLQSLNVEFGNASEGVRDASATLLELSDVFAGMPDGANKTALAVKLFGKAGADLIPLLNLGSAGLDEFARKSDAVGYTLDGRTTKASEAFNDKLQEVTLSIDGLWRQALPSLLPKLDDMADLLNSPQTREGFATVINGLAGATTAALEAAAAIGSFVGGYKSFLADRGLAPGDELNQLQARRKKLQAQAERPLAGLLFGKGTIEKELERLDEEIRRYPFRNVESSVLKDALPSVTPNFLPPPSGGKKAGGRSKESKLPDFLEDDRRALEALVEATAQADEQFNALAASLAGPLTEAAYNYGQEQKQLNELAKVAGIEASELAAAQANLTKQYDEQVEAITRQLNPAKQVIEDMQFELELLGMGNEARAAAIALRYAHADAMSVEGQGIIKLSKQLQEATKADQQWQELQRNLNDGIFDIISGAESASDAIKGFFDSIHEQILRSIAEDWSKQITDIFKGLMGGGAGSGSGSNGAGFWASLFGAFGFGGGRAHGGPVHSNRFYEVGEYNRPEILHSGGKSYLLPGNEGRVAPVGAGAGSGFNQTVNFNLVGRLDNRSQMQAAQAVGIRAQEAMRRNRG